MACSKTLTLNPVSEGDVPLEQAIYSSTHNAIYGVRGGWVHKFNATTGALIASAVFSSDAIGPASITEMAGVIYVCSWWTLKMSFPTAFRNNRDLFTIDPTTLSATNTNIWSDYQGGADIQQYWTYGIYQITNDGTRILGLLTAGSSMAVSPFFVDPSNPDGLEIRSAYMTGGGPFAAELIWDATNNVAVRVGQNYEGIVSFDMSGAFPPTEIQAEYPNQQLVGLCYCASQNRYYAVDNTSILVTVDAANFATIGSVNTGEALANPRRIKYNPVDGYVYVPGWASNSVIVIDPATNTVVATKTGFNQPWDIVFTPTKAFAVQNAPIGLREIT